MVQAEELINLVVSIVFIIYLIFLIRGQSRSLKSFWFGGIMLIFCSQIFTILEGFALPDIFNFSEHIAFTCATLLFMVSLIKNEL